MANFFLLTKLDLVYEQYSRSLLAEYGILMRVTYEPLDKVMELADYSLLKIKRGVRVKIEISFIEKNSVYLQDFLRMCYNASSGVVIEYSAPIDLGGSEIIFEEFNGEPINAQVCKIKATGRIKTKYDNIPAV